jgi:RNA polymerase sigma factor (sigma-70 family)
MDMQANDRFPDDPATRTEVARILSACAPLIQQWCSQAGIQRWEISTERFTRELARCAVARFREKAPSSAELQSHLDHLHLEDLALACACADGTEIAWEYFVHRYRSYLRVCAAAVLRRGTASPEARELADSLFAELYGLSEGQRGSLFRYFHGRSSLKTWLRAVMARRHIDIIRAGRKFEELAGEDGDGGIKAPVAISTSASQAADPHRRRYLQLFSSALQTALDNLEPLDARRLKMYYAEEKKLAEIGRILGEHESSVSRHLEKVRRDLRHAVEEILRAGSGSAGGEAKGLSDAEIELCFEYAAEDAPIDLDKLFSQREFPKESPKAERGGKET